MPKKGKPKKRAPGKKTQPAKRPIPAGPASTDAGPSSAGGTGAKARVTATPAPPSGSGKATRGERIEAARRARRRKKVQLRIAIAGAVALAIGAIAFTLASNRSDARAFRQELTAGSCTFDTRSDPLRAAPNNHVAPPSYAVDPPAGGNHDPSPAGAGNYEQANAPTDARVVHALEHGYVAIWHKPGISEKEKDVVNKVFDRYENDVLVIPRASMPTETAVAATAWGKRLLCQNAELGPLTEFVKKYRNEGPEKVPHT